MSIGDLTYCLSWYQLTSKEKLVIQMIIGRSQKPFQLKGLGVFACSLETYLTVNFAPLLIWIISRECGVF